MKASERVQKFTRFKELHKEGQHGSQEIINQLGISKNTLYNWRKRLNAEFTETKLPHSSLIDTRSFPLFTKIIPQQKPSSSVCHYIEIAIGSTMVIRIPETLQSQALQQIFETLAQWDISR